MPLGSILLGPDDFPQPEENLASAGFVFYGCGRPNYPKFVLVKTNHTGRWFFKLEKQTIGDRRLHHVRTYKLHNNNNKTTINIVAIIVNMYLKIKLPLTNHQYTNRKHIICSIEMYCDSSHQINSKSGDLAPSVSLIQLKDSRVICLRARVIWQSGQNFFLASCHNPLSILAISLTISMLMLMAGWQWRQCIEAEIHHYKTENAPKESAKKHAWPILMIEVKSSSEILCMNTECSQAEPEAVTSSNVVSGLNFMG